MLVQKLKYKRIIILILALLIALIGIYFGFKSLSKNNPVKPEENKLLNMVNKKVEEANFYFDQYNIEIEYSYEYNDTIKKDYIISQSIEPNTNLKDISSIKLVISKGKIDKEKLKNDGINEMGKIPVMMYHGIVNTTNNEYIGGNVDKDGYNRTANAFRNDLEFYYNNNYRMIKLIDYVNRDIKVEYGKSPIVLTFDDGNVNNIKVTGLDDNGNIIIDENSAVGILESFKKKYPDFNITATFFLNEGLFGQPLYNEKILNWLVDNGYDIGNHTKGHVNFTNINEIKSEEAVGYIYNKLDSIIPNKYVNIVALPFGSPYNKTHSNFNRIISGTYEEKIYNTVATLKVGAEPNESPYDKNFDSLFIKRVRAYDNNGVVNDIEMTFRTLKNTHYISDGDMSTIVVNEKDKDKLIDIDKYIITLD